MSSTSCAEFSDYINRDGQVKIHISHSIAKPMPYFEEKF